MDWIKVQGPRDEDYYYQPKPKVQYTLRFTQSGNTVYEQLFLEPPTEQVIQQIQKQLELKNDL